MYEKLLLYECLWQVKLVGKFQLQIEQRQTSCVMKSSLDNGFKTFSGILGSVIVIMKLFLEIRVTRIESNIFYSKTVYLSVLRKLF